MSNGFLYIISGAERFFRETYDSVTSLRRHNPEARATLVCDAVPASMPQLASCFEKIITQPVAPSPARKSLPPTPGLTYKVRSMYAHSPYDRTCFLDSDTYLLADVQPLFDVLEYFDIAMALAPADITPTRLDGRELIVCMPYNSGVILIRKSELTERLFDRWLYWQEKASLDEPDFTGADQATLMRALLEIPCRIGTLHNTWNARTPVHERFSGPVRLIHGRHADFETVARNINITSDVRVWIPKVDLCLYDQMSLSHQLTYCLKATWLLLRRSLRRLVGREKNVAG
jgi:hypothetical protein